MRFSLEIKSEWMVVRTSKGTECESSNSRDCSKVSNKLDWVIFSKVLGKDLKSKATQTKEDVKDEFQENVGV